MLASADTMGVEARAIIPTHSAGKTHQDRQPPRAPLHSIMQQQQGAPTIIPADIAGDAMPPGETVNESHGVRLPSVMPPD